MRSVFVAEGDSARKVEIRTGLSDESAVEVLDGLDRGAFVVTMGQGGLRSGSKLEVLNARERRLGSSCGRFHQRGRRQDGRKEKEEVQEGIVMKAVRFAVEHPVTVSMAALATAVFGFVALTRLDVQLLPDIRYPSLTIQTEFPNTAPEDVENLVTRPVEEAVGVRARTSQGPLHQPGRPLRSDARVRLGHEHGLRRPWKCARRSTSSDLPEEAAPPALLRYDPSLDPVMRIAVSGNGDARRSCATLAERKSSSSISRRSRASPPRACQGGLEEEIAGRDRRSAWPLCDSESRSGRRDTRCARTT